MKAVYEMPRVSIEEFAADSALATNCGINHVIKFDCFLGGSVDQAEVLSTQFNIANGSSGDGTCRVQAGFADYAGITKDDTDDIIGNSQVTLGNVLSNQHTQNNSHIEWTNNSTTWWEPEVSDYADVDNKSSFLGWFYICYQGSSATNSSLRMSHWEVKDNVLKYDGTSGAGGLHAALAPVFSLLALTSY